MAPNPAEVSVRVTAGPAYDPATHQTVLVNAATPTHISSETCTLDLSVRIRNFKGLPHGSPDNSPYFSHPSHQWDQYSISFSLVPHKSISGQNLVFGNDIDHPVRDRLPYGTGAAFHILKSVIDPGLDGDLYADKPHLCGNALSSFNILRVGEKLKEGHELETAKDQGDNVIEEGGDGEGLEWRKQREVPEAASNRKTWFLGKGRPETWDWEEGRQYQFDFFNPYLDFNDFSLKLPGFSLSVLGYLGGDDYLRYVLKNKETGDVLFVVVFSLVKKSEIEKEEHPKEEHFKEDTPQTSADDVD